MIICNFCYFRNNNLMRIIKSNSLKQIKKFKYFNFLIKNHFSAYL